jgi:hypothetical protein
VIFFLIFTGLFVNPVGFIMLFIRMSLQMLGAIEKSKFFQQENLWMLGKSNSGDKAIKPDKGKFGFY